MFFYQNPLKWVKNLEISASSAWDPAGLVFGQMSDFSENQETIVANAGIGYQDGGKLGFLVVLKKDTEGSYEQVQTIMPSGLNVYGSDSFSSIAIISKDSSTIIAYASTETGTGTIDVDSPDTGVIVVFQSGSAGYVQSQILLPPTDLTSRALFQPLEISDDGNRLFIRHSTSYSRTITYNEKGKLYVYEKNVSGLFELQQTIEPPNDNSLVNFGSIYVDDFYLSQDKTHFFVSNHNVSGSFNNQGAVYFYESGSNGYELTDIIVDQDEIGDDGRFGTSITYSSQNNLLAVNKSKPDWSGSVILYQSGSNGFQKVQTIENFADENLNSSYLTEDGTTLLTTVYKNTNNPKNKRTIRFYQSGSNGFQPTGVELETDDTYTNWDFFAFPNYRLDYDKPAGRIIATAHGYDIEGVGSDVGAIYVFDSGSSGWQQSQLITASDDWSPSEDHFGVGIKISADENLLFISQNNDYIVSNNSENANKSENAKDSVNGSLYVFKKEGNNYQQIQRIVDPASTFMSSWSENFARSFSINTTGTRVAISNPKRDYNQDQTDDWHGTIYIFDSGSNGYVLTQEIKRETNVQWEMMGITIEMSRTGQKLFSSYYGNDTTNWKGSVLVYQSGSNGFQEVQILEVSDPDGNPEFDYLGNGTIVISDDENVLLIDASGDEESGTDWAGAVYVFVSGSSGYQQTQKLEIANPISSYGYFGHAGRVAIRDDNSEIVIGAFNDNYGNNRQGTVYIYESGSNGYQLSQAIEAPSEEAISRGFGASVDISGSYLAVGASLDPRSLEDTAFSNRGAVYVYEKVNGTYELKHRIVQEDNRNTQGYLTIERGAFGSRVKLLSNNELLVSSPHDDKNGIDSGVVYKYKLTRDY